MKSIKVRLAKLEGAGAGFAHGVAVLIRNRDGQVETRASVSNPAFTRSKERIFTGDTFGEVSNAVSAWWEKHGTSGTAIHVDTERNTKNESEH